MALEVALANKDLNKYNPQSVFLDYSGAAAVWTSLGAGHTLAQCPGAVSAGSDIDLVRGHMDAYLAYARGNQPDMANFHGDPLFFAFPTYIVHRGHARRNVIQPYGNSLMMMYLLARADDEAANPPRAACYLTAAVDCAKSWLRLMVSEGYNPALATPQLRLQGYTGLYGRYPSWWSAYSPGWSTPSFYAKGDLGKHGCKSRTLQGSDDTIHLS